MNKKMNMETTADDLLMLPDIDGIVKDIRGQKTISGQSKTEVKTEQPEEAPAETDNTSSEGGSNWEVFLRCSQSYDYRVRNDDRRVYPIDNDIINTLQTHRRSGARARSATHAHPSDTPQSGVGCRFQETKAETHRRRDEANCSKQDRKSVV